MLKFFVWAAWNAVVGVVVHGIDSAAAICCSLSLDMYWRSERGLGMRDLWWERMQSISSLREERYDH